MAFHTKTWALLPENERTAPGPVDELLAWASRHQVSLPASYVEWARYDRGELLERYSNDDHFSFDEPTILKTDAGLQALVIHRENQGGFQAAVPLGQGDDPPVLFAWCGRPPWIHAAKSLSDYLFAQVFDWQHQLVFSEVNPEFKEMASSSRIEFGAGGIETFVGQDFAESVSTSFIVEGLVYKVRRFQSPSDERVIVTTPKDGQPSALITGEHARVQMLEEVIREAMFDRVVPPTFGSVLAAMNFIGRLLEQEKLRLLALSCLQPTSPKLLTRLAATHRRVPLSERLAEERFPKEADRFVVGGRGLGAWVRFARVEPGRWVIDGIERAGVFGVLFSGGH